MHPTCVMAALGEGGPPPPVRGALADMARAELLSRVFPRTLSNMCCRIVRRILPSSILRAHPIVKNGGGVCGQLNYYNYSISIFDEPYEHVDSIFSMENRCQQVVCFSGRRLLPPHASRCPLVAARKQSSEWQSYARIGSSRRRIRAELSAEFESHSMLI